MTARRSRTRDTIPSLQRRGLVLALATVNIARAQDTTTVRNLSRNEEEAAVTVRRLTGDAKPQTGRIQVVLPQVAESGNSVPLTVRVESPMTPADHVRTIHIVGERNPRPWVASFRLGPRAGKAEVETNIRLSDSGNVAVYVQMSDGSWWVQRTSVIVTIGACENLAVRY